MGIPECRECQECQERQIDNKCHKFSEPQDRCDLNYDAIFSRMVGILGMSGMLRILGMSEQT